MLALVDMGCVAYEEVHNIQKTIVENRIQGMLNRNACLLVEHSPVFTLGRRAEKQYLQLGEDFLVQKGVDLVETNRGGEVTYHGPGQLIAYPILHLPSLKLGVADYVHLLEEVMILTSADFGVQLNRDPRNAGVWIGDSKLGSIGIAVRKGFTYHGLALNVSLDLSPFTWITPCGLNNVHMSSLENEQEKKIPMEQVKARMSHHLSNLLDLEYEVVEIDELLSKGRE